MVFYALKVIFQEHITNMEFPILTKGKLDQEHVRLAIMIESSMNPCHAKPNSPFLHHLFCLLCQSCCHHLPPLLSRPPTLREMQAPCQAKLPYPLLDGLQRRLRIYNQGYVAGWVMSDVLCYSNGPRRYMVGCTFGHIGLESAHPSLFFEYYI